MIRLAYIVSHPIQYQAPLLRRIASEPGIDFTALFLSDFSTRQYRDPGFGQSIAWDVDLLSGYDSKVLRAWGDSDGVGLLQPLTIGVEEELRAGGYDAVWLHGYAHHAQLRALVAAKKRGLKVLLRGESHAASSQRSAVKTALKQQILTRLFRKVDAFLAIGTANRDYYMSYGVAPEKIFMMPYAVDNARFQATATAERGRALVRSLGLDPSRPVILYASKLQTRKRPWDLWRAYERLSPDGRDEPAPYLVYVGDGEERAALEAAVASRGWTSVHFAGFQSQRTLPDYYAACDVFVLPSEREPWGLVVNEVMNAGKPVIVSDQVGAAADLVEDGVNGFVVPVGDVETLADRLRWVTDDRAVARAMGEKSLQRVSEWDYEADVQGLLQAVNGCGGRG